MAASNGHVEAVSVLNEVAEMVVLKRALLFQLLPEGKTRWSWFCGLLYLEKR